MSASVTIEEVVGAAVLIGFDNGPQIELDGGQSSASFDQIGTTVQVFTTDPTLSDPGDLTLLFDNRLI